MILRILPQAETDISDIAIYIAHDSKRAALGWVQGIERHFARLLAMPGMGVARDDVRTGLRMLPAGNYVILYRQSDETVDIVRVLDGRRKWQDLL